MLRKTNKNEGSASFEALPLFCRFRENSMSYFAGFVVYCEGLFA